MLARGENHVLSSDWLEDAGRNAMRARSYLLLMPVANVLSAAWLFKVLLWRLACVPYSQPSFGRALAATLLDMPISTAPSP